VTVIFAVFVRPTAVAVTVPVPAESPAVNSPSEFTVPIFPDVAQVTEAGLPFSSNAVALNY